MNNSRKTQLLIVAVVGILLFSFLPTAQGWSSRKTNVTIRPIDDWLQNSPFGIGVPWETCYVGDDNKDNHYWIFTDSVFGAFTGNTYEYSGYVKEKVLRDGSIEITVNLDVKDIYLEAYAALYDENGDPIWGQQYFGDMGDILLYAYVDYFFQLKFTLDAEYDGYAPWGVPPGTREAGCTLPYFDAIFYLPEELGIHLHSLMLVGHGDGFTFEPGWRWPAPDEPFPDGPFEDGGTAKIFFLHYARFGPDDAFVWPYGASGFSMNTIRIY